MRAGDERQRARRRKLAEPNVSWIRTRFFERGATHRSIESATRVKNAHARRRGKKSRGERGTQRIFHLAKMSDHRNVERASRFFRARRVRHWAGGLHDNGCFSAVFRGDFAFGEGVQNDELVGDIERAARGAIVVNVVREIGSGERNDDRALGKSFARFGNRFRASTRVKSDDEICSADLRIR